MKAGKDKYGKQVFSICGLACDDGKDHCPRHIMLVELKVKTDADKAAAKKATAQQALRTAARR